MSRSPFPGLTLAALALALVAGPALADPDCYFGLPHTAVGNATLGTDPAGRLTVSNIGSSGLDGVEIDLGTATGFAVQLDPGPSGALPANSEVCVYVGCPQIDDYVKLDAVAVAGGQGELSLQFGDGLAPQCVHVELRLGESVVASRTWAFDHLLESGLVTGAFGSDPAGNPVTVQASRGATSLSVFVFEPQEISAEIAGSATGPVVCDNVVLTVDGLPPGEPVTRTLIACANMPGNELTVEGEYLESRDPSASVHPVVTASGNATMHGLAGQPLCESCPECWSPPDPDPNDLRSGVEVSNIGSSGEDGVSFQCRPWGSPWFVSDYDLRLDNLLIPGGGMLRLETTGVFAGMPAHPLGTCELADDGAGTGGLALRADFGVLGSSEVTVEVYDAGLLSGSFVTTGGPGVTLATISPTGGPLGWNKCGKLGGVGITPCYVMCSDGFFMLDDGTGVPLVGNELRVLATGSTGSISSIDSFSVRAADTGDFVVVWVSSPPGSDPSVGFSGLVHAPVGASSLAVGDLDGDDLDDMTVTLSGPGGLATNLGGAEGGGYRSRVFTSHFDLVQFDIYDDQCPTCPGGVVVSADLEATGIPGETAYRPRFRGQRRGKVTLLKSNGDTGGDFDVDDEDMTIITDPGDDLVVHRLEGSARHLSDAVFMLMRCDVGQASGTGVTVSHPVHGTFTDIARILVSDDETPSSVGAIDRMCLTATPSPACVDCSFTVEKCRVAQFGQMHGAAGGARLLAQTCEGDDGSDPPSQSLVISNIGAKGLDGVDIRLPPLPTKGARLALCCFGNDPDDLCIVPIGRVAGGAPGPLASTGIRLSNPGERVLSTDFGAGLTVQVTVRDQFGNVVAQSGVMPGGDVATLLAPDMPDEVTADYRGGDRKQLLQWYQDMAVMLPGQPAVAGRSVEVSAASLPGAPADIDVERIDLRVSAVTGQTTALRIDDEVILEAPCPGDTNGDGLINVDDLNNVILDWGSDGSANGGDITGPIPGSPPDGVVTVDDLNAVIVNWGSCG